MRQSIGWDWGGSEARWVELVEDRGQLKVRAFGTSKGRPGGDGAAEPLRAVVAERRWRGREVVTALPRTAVTLAWMSLPAAARDDLAGMVELEAAQTLPFSVDEAAWDFAADPAADAGQAVLLVAARRQLVEERRRQVEALGLRLGALTVDVIAAAALARAALAESTDAGVLALLDGSTVTLSYLSRGRVLMSRTAALALEATGGQRNVAALALEVRRSLVAGASSPGGGAPGAGEMYVWLAGDGADARLAEDLGAAMPNSSSAAIRVALLPLTGIEGADALPRSVDLALGLALLGMRAPGSTPWDGIDLGSKARAAVDTAAPRRHRRLPWLVGTGAAALAIALILLEGPSAKDRELARTARRAQTEAKQFAAKRGELAGQVRTLTSAIVPRHSYLDVLNEVSTLAGSQIWLTQFTYDRGHPVLIRGAARTTSAVARLVDGLRVSPHLLGVTLGNMTEGEIDKIPVIQFTISGSLRGDSPLEPPKRRQKTRQPKGEET